MNTSTRTRRRVIVSAPGEVGLVTEALPDLLPDEALVSLQVAGVCGSDIHGLHGTHPTMKPPYYPGHEVVGVVEALGSDVTGLAVGQLVTPEPTLPCGHCKMCITGRSNICENMQFFGCGFREGGMADVFSVRASRLHVVPEGFDLRMAALIEPFSTPLHAVRLAGDISGKAVAIIGCGTIGLLMLAAARARGAARIVMTDVLESKRQGALELGADAVVDSASPDVAALVREQLGETADVVFDCVSIQPTVVSAIDMVQRGGTVVIVGVPSRPIEVPAFVLQDRQVRLQGAATYVSEDYAAAIRIIAAGGVDTGHMITATYPLEQTAEAFAAAASGDQIKVLLTGEGVELG
ncbi:zinc-dependent alcohol dehydrogenase [Herbiconiux flava]|uniref:2-desacetyl-2-hydroxyethyl bacteriochlorophyllide A dehydrogenase n=1 Tax=Herbiconiux flava TaxID=881268 RepID=A0A852SI19_9MICO|nr:alcohol dehydrogenase catalytic domain-containing protein [Herbiconiux flava]NYD69354.1 2-desacetyl-2-hydroxyethyl bacteriochlorophyllide A dehydrogenase [Herbiconiux flava]GLK16101.1 alcohol dehydrogenase [Herbiconiux flava]